MCATRENNLCFGVLAGYSLHLGACPGSSATLCTREMTTEALHTQLDTVRWEKQQLEVENARLQEANPGEAARE